MSSQFLDLTGLLGVQRAEVRVVRIGRLQRLPINAISTNYFNVNYTQIVAT